MHSHIFLSFAKITKLEFLTQKPEGYQYTATCLATIPSPHLGSTVLIADFSLGYYLLTRLAVISATHGSASKT